MFSIEEDKRVCAFAYGVGIEASFPCGKSEISNVLTKPCNRPA